MRSRTRLVRASVLLAVALTLASASVATAASKPLVSGAGASAITANSATIAASVNPEGSAASYYVKYWTSTGVWTSARLSAGSGTTAVNVAISLANLNSGMQYSYRVIAVNGVGSATTKAAGFKTGTSSSSGSGGSGPGNRVPELHPQTIWTAGITPLSDAQAAALVTHEPEQRAANTAANDYVPTNAQLSAFHASTPSYLQNPLRAYVTGRPGLSNPSTDDLIQWAAHKWGIPEDWIRAEMVVESHWYQSGMGDNNPVSSSWYLLYPVFSEIAGSLNVYQSLGVMQVKWLADNSGVGAGTEPLRWESTAFNLDFYASTVRWLYDGLYPSWVPNIYAGNAWQSIGGWYGGTSAGQQQYITYVQKQLAAKPWLQPGF